MTVNGAEISPVNTSHRLPGSYEEAFESLGNSLLVLIRLPGVNFAPKISDLRPETPKTQTPKPQTPRMVFKLVSVLWSRKVHRQQQERSEVFIFSGLSLSRRSNSEKLTGFKIHVAADISMAFAGECFTEEIDDTVAIMLFKVKSVYASVNSSSAHPPPGPTPGH